MQELITLLKEEGADALDLSDDTLLLDCGLDSMAFAILVARLEGSLGGDPFSIAAEPIYPRTLGEFIEFYEATLRSS